MFTTLGRIFAITALIAGSLATQENAPEPVPARHITFQNLAPFARREWVATIVPFKSGEVPAGELPDLHVSERATLWLPFGARWPDGSLRFARCLVRIEITKFGELRLPLLGCFSVYVCGRVHHVRGDAPSRRKDLRSLR